MDTRNFGRSHTSVRDSIPEYQEPLLQEAIRAGAESFADG